MLLYMKIRDVKSPSRGTPDSAGIDFYVPNNFFPSGSIGLLPGQAAIIPSGIQVKVPAGYALIMFNKSGVAVNQGLQVGACVIDSDYQGEVHLHVHNVGMGRTTINNGQKLVQGLLIPLPIMEVKEVEHLLFDKPTKRGEGGFGSTGKY